MSSLLMQRYTPEQHLEVDRKAESRNECVGSEILAMAGASREYNRITLNIGASLTEQLRGKPCAEHYTRQSEDVWTLVELSSLSHILRPTSVGCDLPLSVICERIEFSQALRRRLLTLTQQASAD